MPCKVQISFSEPGKLWQEFLTSLSSGYIKLARNKYYIPGEKLELELRVPFLKQVILVPAQIKAPKPGQNFLEAVILAPERIKKLLPTLEQFQIYNGPGRVDDEKGKRVELEEITELKADLETEEPVFVIKPKNNSRTHSLSFSCELIRPVKSSISRINLPPIKGQVPIARLQVFNEKKSIKPKSDSIKKNKIILVEERAWRVPQEVPFPDLFQKLKAWLKIEEENLNEEITPTKNQYLSSNTHLSRDIPKDISAICTFLKSLGKALLRENFYLPTHPESQFASEKLYNELKNLLSSVPELGIILVASPDSPWKIFLTGITLEPLAIPEFLFHQYLEFFQKSHLRGLFFKSSLTQEHFDQFLEGISQFSSQESGIGQKLSRVLPENLLKPEPDAVLLIFEEDLLYLAPGLDWQVEMGIHRLAKELKLFSRFIEGSPDRISELKSKLYQNFLASFQKPEIIKELILNAGIIPTQIPLLKQEDPARELIENLSPSLLIPVGNYFLQEMFRLEEQKLNTENFNENILFQLELTWSLLLKIAKKVIKERCAGFEQFLERLCRDNIIPLSELPSEIKKKINREFMADEFQKWPEFWLERFTEENSAPKIELLLKFFSAIIPPLLQRKDWQNLYLLTETVIQLSPFKQKLFAEQGINNPTQVLWEKSALALVQNLWEQNLETQKGITEIFLLLGEFGFQIIYQALVEEKDFSRKKFLIEALLRFGPPSLEKLRELLRDPTKPANLKSLAIEALGRNRCPEDAERVRVFLHHPDYQLRIQALTALVRIRELEALPSIESLLNDSHPLVRKRVIFILGMFAGKSKTAKDKLWQIIFGFDTEEELRLCALQELAKNPSETESERENLQKNLFTILEEEKAENKTDSNLVQTKSGQELLKLTTLDLLGKIGDQKALEKLSQMNFCLQTLALKKEQTLNLLRLRLNSS